MREALRRLAAEGLVSLTTKRGAHVATWSTADAEVVFDMRSLLEPYAAARAAERIDDRALGRLRHLDEQMQAAAAAEAYRDIPPLNNAFHVAIVEAAAAAKLTSVLRPLIHVPLIPRGESHDASATAHSLAHHRDLIRALAEGDAADASRVMRDHLHHARTALLRLVGATDRSVALDVLFADHR